MPVYRAILRKYDVLRLQIEEKTHVEGDRRVICYTKIRTDIPGFYQEMEQYEIYNGRRPFEEFRAIVLSRYARWQDDNKIYECSLFQNTVEDMILFRQAPDEEILRFYREAAEALEGKAFRIVYLESGDIRANLDVVRKERTDDRGSEVWFSLVCQYFNTSPYALEHGLRDFEGFAAHLQHRQALELRICREIFPDRAIILRSKKVDSFFSEDSHPDWNLT